MATEEDGLEGKFESDLGRWDYENPILLRPEYQGLPVTGNFDLETAERILRRVIGIVRLKEPDKFKDIQNVLNYNPEVITDNNYHRSTSVRFQGVYDYSDRDKLLEKWIEFSISKDFQRNPHFSRHKKIPEDYINVNGFHSRDYRRKTIDADSAVKVPLTTNVLEIPANMEELYYSTRNPSFQLDIVLYNPEHSLHLHSEINLDIKFPKELLRI